MTTPEQPGGDSSRPAPRQKRSNDKTSFIVAWTGQVSRDEKLSKGANRISPSISQNLWPHKELEGRYVLKRGQKFFADYLRVSRKSIQIWFDDLVRHGHLEVEVRKGQGQINEVMPVLIPTAKSAAVLEPMADETPSPSNDETMPPVDVAEAEPADPLRLPDDGVTPILHEMSLSEVEDLIARLDDDIAWLRANVHEPASGFDNLQDSEYLAFANEVEVRESRFEDLVDVLIAAFPVSKNATMSQMVRNTLVGLIRFEADPLELIRDAREYVRATESAGEKPKGPWKWIQAWSGAFHTRRSTLSAAS